MMKKLLLLITLGVSTWAMGAEPTLINGLFYTIERGYATVTKSQGAAMYSGYIIIPDSVKNQQGVVYPVSTIDTEAFQGCSIDSVIIPQTVSNIKDKAFENCTKLKNISVYRTSPPNLGMDVFSNGTSSATLYVPQSVVETYRQDNGWQVFQVVKPLDAKPHQVDVDTTTVASTATLTWDAVPKATNYVLRIFTDQASIIKLDTTLYFNAKGEVMKSPVRKIVMDDIGSITIITIDPYSATVSSSSSMAVDLNYNMKALGEDNLILEEEQSSFTLVKKSPTSLQATSNPSVMPEAIYDMRGQHYSIEAIDQLPQGTYIIQQNGQTKKYTRTY